MKTLAMYSIKGGVGKTTCAVNLAYEAAKAGTRVLLWDLDPQGAATFFLRVEAHLKGGADRLVGGKGELHRHVRATDHDGLDLVPADFSLRHLDLYLDEKKRPTRRLARLLDPVGDDYDLAVLDCAPGMTLTSETVFAAADVLLVPTIPTTLSQRTLGQLTAFLGGEPVRPLVLPFASMLDRRKKLQRDVAAALAETFPGFLRTIIPNTSVIERMGVERAPVGAYAPRSASAAAFRALWAEVAAQLWP